MNRSRTTTQAADLIELHQLCREGRLYEVEQWVREGRPLQLAREAAVSGRRRAASALGLAVQAGNHSLVLLLLANGYDPNLERDSPLDLALTARRWKVVDLLLEWGADPHAVDPAVLFGTYRSSLFTRFWDFGVDLTDGHALAEFLAEHPGAKPLLGFARRHRDDPRMQRELDVALVYHAGKGNEKGVQLCMWAGGNPHVPACDLRYGRPCQHTAGDRADKDEDPDEDAGYRSRWSAIDEACRAGHVALLQRLKPNPELDNFDELYKWAHDRHVIQHLMEIARPADANGVLQHHLWRLGWRRDEWQTLDALEALFEAGLRWTTTMGETAAGLRQALLKLSDNRFMDVVGLLSKADYCAPEILREIGRTPAAKKRFKELGYLGFDEDEDRRSSSFRYREPPRHARRVISQFGLHPPKAKKPTTVYTPAYARIGPARRSGQELHLTRKDLYERVWTTPVATLAVEWGVSGPGLKKACKRLGVPVPPRGYWARVASGQRPRRAGLLGAVAGVSENVVVSLPGAT